MDLLKQQHQREFDVWVSWQERDELVRRAKAEAAEQREEVARLRRQADEAAAQGDDLRVLVEALRSVRAPLPPGPCVPMTVFNGPG